MVDQLAGICSHEGCVAVTCLVMLICSLVQMVSVAHFSEREGAGCSRDKLVPGECGEGDGWAGALVTRSLSPPAVLYLADSRAFLSVPCPPPGCC